jgi:signal transduction histidine kinase
MGKTQSPERQIRVLLVDDDRDDYVLTRDLLAEISGDRYELNWRADYQTGLEGICRGGYDVILIDYQLGAKSGLDLLIESVGEGCQSPVIMMTGQSELELDLAAMQAGAVYFLEKSRLDGIILERAIRFALRHKQSEFELEKKVRARTLELAKANQALLEADRRKDEFLATLAHELRNPLAPIRNALEIMRMKGTPEALDQARQIVERQITHMVRLINDLLDVSRVSRGKLSISMAPTSLAEAIAIAVETSQPLLDRAKVSLSMQLPTQQVVIRADRMRLSQVFSNLLNNAAKFTEPDGKVILTAEREDPQVKISIRDTGVGIPPDILPQVFDLFTQVDRTLNRSQGGLGIGLALVRQLVQLHGGTVEVKSDGIGKGTEFVVRLPLHS